jgi:hypothetical protein
MIEMLTCPEDPENEATYQCESCGKQYCDRCVCEGKRLRPHRLPGVRITGGRFYRPALTTWEMLVADHKPRVDEFGQAYPRVPLQNRIINHTSIVQARS